MYDLIIWTSKTSAIIALPPQNLSIGGHALRHSSLYEFVVESSIAMKQRSSIWICLNSLVKGFVIVLTQHIEYDTPVAGIQNSAPIELMYLNALVPFEFCYITSHFAIFFATGYIGRLEYVPQMWLLVLDYAISSSPKFCGVEIATRIIHLYPVTEWTSISHLIFFILERLSAPPFTLVLAYRLSFADMAKNQPPLLLHTVCPI